MERQSAGVKQVIVMRTDTDPPMRKGKMIAQGSHASIAFLTRRVQWFYRPIRQIFMACFDMLMKILYDRNAVVVVITDEQKKWIEDRFTKVCLRVDSEVELLEIYKKAVESGLETHLVKDSGQTEFKEPTLTCLAIGPNKSEDIDKVTGHLKLL